MGDTTSAGVQIHHTGDTPRRSPLARIGGFLAARREVLRDYFSAVSGAGGRLIFSLAYFVALANTLSISEFGMFATASAAGVMLSRILAFGFISALYRTATIRPNLIGTFTAGSSQLRIGDGRLQIEQDGPHRKFVEHVQQITYSGPYGARCGQRVLYITERAVFELTPAGLTLIEIAPGIDLDRDVLAHMDFKPIVSASLRLMDAALFREELISLAVRLAERGRITPRSVCIAAGEGVPT